jgi:glycosyltransferase involved in cell wall biosynthesis
MAKPVFERLVHERKYDLFVGRHLKYSGQAGILGQNAAIVDIDDNEIELYRLIIKNPNTGALRRQVLKKRVQTLERLLPRLLRNGPYLWVSNEDDRHTVGFEHARVLPNIPYALSLSNPPPSLPARPQSKTLLFVGMLSYIYNREGIAWFLNEVWPAIRNQEPDARFRIVGSRLRKQDQEIWGAAPGVEVSGFVKDLKEAYADCAFVVVPVWSGGGTNIKVLEALMYGRTCVLSQPAYRGYGQVFDGENALLVARDANEMIRFCLQLLDNPGRCEAMGQNGAKVVNRQFSYDRFERTVLDSVEVVMRGQRSGIVAAS